MINKKILNILFSRIIRTKKKKKKKKKKDLGEMKSQNPDLFMDRLRSKVLTKISKSEIKSYRLSAETICYVTEPLFNHQSNLSSCNMTSTSNFKILNQEIRKMQQLQTEDFNSHVMGPKPKFTEEIEKTGINTPTTLSSKHTPIISVSSSQLNDLIIANQKLIHLSKNIQEPNVSSSLHAVSQSILSVINSTTRQEITSLKRKLDSESIQPQLNDNSKKRILK